MTELTADLTAKSEEIRKLHAGHEQILNEIWRLVGVPGDVVNEARMFDENVLSKTGEANKQKIVMILCKYDYSVNMTLKLVRKLLNSESRNQGTVPNHLGSPSRAVVGESSGAKFKAPQEQNQSPRTIRDQVIVPAGVQSPSFLGPPRTIADVMGRVEAEPTSPATSITQHVVSIPLP